VTMVVFGSEVCSTFSSMSSQTLLSDHVCTVNFLDFTIFVQQMECYKKQIIIDTYCAFVGQI